MPEPSITHPWIKTALTHGPVKLQALPYTPDCGAQTFFLGRTRAETHPDHGPLIRLDYEVYEPMAKQLLRTLAQTLAAEFQLAAVRLVHAVGPVPLGGASVAIEIAAPHRGAAFDACRAGIDRVKEQLPVWKNEVWKNGQTFAPGW
ncbi:MAG: molybdenum cofactor biosynthesis protein MoaE, partial [Algisphaera sp.]